MCAVRHTPVRGKPAVFASPSVVPVCRRWVRIRPQDMHRAFHLVGWGYVAICATLVFQRGMARSATSGSAATTTRSVTPGEPNAAALGSHAEAEQWFRRVRPYCIPVEVAVVQPQI